MLPMSGPGALRCNVMPQVLLTPPVNATAAALACLTRMFASTTIFAIDNASSASAPSFDDSGLWHLAPPANGKAVSFTRPQMKPENRYYTIKTPSAALTNS